jgi:hypothetical protein
MGLTALPLALIAAVALKTRRILSIQDESLKIALGGLAEHELARQDLETRLDDIAERLDAVAAPEAAAPPRR